MAYIVINQIKNLVYFYIHFCLRNPFVEKQGDLRFL